MKALRKWEFYISSYSELEHGRAVVSVILCAFAHCWIALEKPLTGR
jgi:hypothetical protein